MNKFKNLIYIFIITFIIFIFTDFIFGKTLLSLLKIENIENIYRIQNNNYSYTFKKNFKTNSASWGKEYYKFCSNNLGFKYNCKDGPSNNYEIVFIGDSMTEGIGLPYEKTFVGKFQNETKLSVANMAVASYSPVIYLKKINYFIKNNLIFDHLIVGVDLTDFEDDWRRDTRYKKNENNKKKTTDFKNTFKLFLNKNLPISFYLIKQINWFYKLNFTDYSDHKHLDYHNYGASWSYTPKGKNFYKKKEIILGNLNELYVLLKANGIKFSIIIFPHQASILYDNRNSTYYKTFKDFCNFKCYRFFDAYNTFFDLVDKSSRKDVSKKYFIELDSHLNENGHEIVSKVILDNL